MIGYITIGTNDFEKSKAFYEKALAALNMRKTFANERMQGYGVKGQPGSLVVCKPYDEQPRPPTAMARSVALSAPTRRGGRCGVQGVSAPRSAAQTKVRRATAAVDSTPPISATSTATRSPSSRWEPDPCSATSPSLLTISTRSKAFYDKTLAGLNGKLAMKTARGQLYGNGNGPLLGITGPFDGKPAGHGNGAMVALTAPSRAVVEQVYNDALAAGATGEGAPGIRTGTCPAFYGAYFRDPDGNKICVFTTGA